MCLNYVSISLRFTCICHCICNDIDTYLRHLIQRKDRPADCAPQTPGRAISTKIQSKDRPTSSYRHAENSDFTCIIYADLLPLYRVSYMFIHRLPTSTKSSTTAPYTKHPPHPNPHPDTIFPRICEGRNGREICRARARLSGLG